jgi:hypothetical protein
MSDITLPPGAEPVLRHPRADVAYYALQQIRDLGSVICWEYNADEGDPSAVLTTTYIQVDCRAANRARAYQVADQVRRTLKAFPWHDWNEAIFSEVESLDGPRWMPDENGAPRFVARYAIHHHPRQGRP